MKKEEMKADGLSRGKKPAYLEVYVRIRDKITGGVYHYGERLPSKRALAEQTGTSVITIEHAYQLLVDEGYAESREDRKSVV